MGDQPPITMGYLEPTVSVNYPDVCIDGPAAEKEFYGDLLVQPRSYAVLTTTSTGGHDLNIVSTGRYGLF